MIIVQSVKTQDTGDLVVRHIRLHNLGEKTERLFFFLNPTAASWNRAAAGVVSSLTLFQWQNNKKKHTSKLMKMLFPHSNIY